MIFFTKPTVVTVALMLYSVASVAVVCRRL